MNRIQNLGAVLTAALLLLPLCAGHAQTSVLSLPPLTSGASGDKIYIVDVSDLTSSTGGTAKTITIGNLSLAVTPAFAQLTSVPTTLAGFGITDPVALTSGSYANPAWITSLAKSKVGLSVVENTALSTWAGSTALTTLGTISAGSWQGNAIDSGFITPVLADKTYNGLEISSTSGGATLNISVGQVLTVLHTVTFDGEEGAEVNVGSGAALSAYATVLPNADILTFLGSSDLGLARTNLGLTIGVHVQAYSANLSTFAGIAPSANVQTLLGAANYAAARTSLGLVIGTDVQAYHANLASLSSTPGNLLAPSFTSLTDGATVTVTCSATKAVQNATVTLGGNRTLAISGAANGMTGVLIVKQDGTGSRTLTLPAGSKVIGNGGGAVTLSTAANAIDVLCWVYDGTNYLWTTGTNFN